MLLRDNTSCCAERSISYFCLICLITTTSHLLCESSDLTSNGSASITAIAVVASGNAAITTEVTTVATSSIGVITIIVTTIATIAANNSVATAATTLSLLVHIVVACVSTRFTDSRQEWDIKML